MLTVKRAAAQAGVCQTVVRRWIAAGLLPHYRLGSPGRRGGIRVAEADLDALLASRKAGAVAPPPPPVKRTPLKHIRA